MADEGTRTVKLRTAVWMTLGSAAFVGAFFAGVLVARAKPEPGGGTAAPLSFAGTLKQNGQPMTGKQALTFTLRKGEVSCTVEPVEVEVDADGHFTAPIPLGQEGGCPAGFFDGSDVALEVTVKGATFAGDVCPVPYAKYAEQVGTPDCPVGYDRDVQSPNPENTESILCRKGRDEVVRVGVGGSAFWVDRYEAVLVTNDDKGTRIQDPSSLASFPRNGQWTGATPPVRAESRRGELPTANITWFQANEACRASGKRLPTGDEWLASARGTPDSGGSAGDQGKCYNSGPVGFRITGIDNPIPNVSCISSFGAEDMIGNAWEMTAEWYAGAAAAAATLRYPWPVGSLPGSGDGYADDATYNVSGTVLVMEAAPGESGAPAIGLRGGSNGGGTDNGIFSLDLDWAPSSWASFMGFRCVRVR